jgi:hypothetical protein
LSGAGGRASIFWDSTAASWNPGRIAAIATCNGGQAVERSSASATGSKRSLLRGNRLPEPVGPIVEEINRAVRGWGAYFRVGNSSRKFAQVDDHVRERLALFLGKKTGRHGRHQERYTYAYFKRLRVHRLVGTVKWYVATPIATR